MKRKFREASYFGYFGLCDGCHEDIEGFPVRYLVEDIGSSGARRYYHFQCAGGEQT